MSQELLQQLIFSSIGQSMSIKQLEMFEKYTNELLDWNNRINLTAITERKQIAIKHYCDSLLVMRFHEWRANSKVLDLGSGAGFPGLPLKIANPQLNMALLDSQKKRITFLGHMIESLELHDIKTIQGRAEDIAKNDESREAYDFVLSRAVAKLSVLLEYAMPFVKIGGYFVAYKGPEVDEEFIEAGGALKALGGKHCETIEAELPVLLSIKIPHY